MPTAADDDLSQSTPPLEDTSSATVPYSRSYTLERTPVIQVTKLPRTASSGVHTPVKMRVTPVSVGRGKETRRSGRRQVECEGKGGRGGSYDGDEMEEWMCETPPLREEGEGGMAVGDGRTNMQQGVAGEVGGGLCEGVEREVGEVVEVVEGSKGKLPENTSQALHTHSERGPLLLSLRKGKKRASSSEPGHSPFSKKTRVVVNHSKHVKGDEVEGHEPSNATRPSHSPSSLNGTAQPLTKRCETELPPVVSGSGGAGKSELPELFAPEGVDPATYTATILCRLNSYIHRLRVAQEKVTARLPWSDPVPSYHRQPRTSLDYRYRRRRSNTTPHGWPTINLDTGTVSHCAPGSTASSSKPASHSSSKRQKNETPVRSSHSQKRKILCADNDDSEQWFVPNQPSSLKRHSKSSSVSAHPPTPDPPTQPPVDNTTPPLDSPRGDVDSASGQPSDSEPHSRSVLPDHSRDADSDHPSSNTAGLPVPPLTSSGTRETMETEIGNPGGGTSGPGTTAPPDECDSEEEEGEGTIGVIGLQGSRKRRRASHILDDSEPEEEAEVMAKNSDSTVSSGEVGADHDLGLKTNGQESVPLSTSALPAFSSGKRFKSLSFQRLPVKSMRNTTSEQGASGRAGDVIDLTEDGLSAKTRDAASSPSTSPTSSSPPLPPSRSRVLGTRRTRAKGSPERQAGDGAEVEEERVPCPLCGESYVVSAIEAHAAGCLESGESSPVLDRTRNCSLRQSSLLTPRFRKLAYQCIK